MPDAAAAPAVFPADSPPAVRIRGLTKTYRGSKAFRPSRALRGIDLDIPKGSVFGLLGPNGAGKSTLINILAGLVNKTGGTVSIWGIDIDRHPRRSRAAIGVVPQETEYRRFLHAARTAQLSGRPVRRAEARPDYRRIARGRPAGRQGGKLFAHAFRRHAAAAHGRQGDGSQAAGSGAGRTDRRSRCRIAPAIVGPHPDAEPVRDDHPADNPLSGGSAGTVRPDRLHQPWRGHRLRHDRGIAEADGPQGSDHPPGRAAERPAAGTGGLQRRTHPAAAAGHPLSPEPDQVPGSCQRRARKRPDDRRPLDPGERPRRPVP